MGHRPEHMQARPLTGASSPRPLSLMNRAGRLREPAPAHHFTARAKRQLTALDARPGATSADSQQAAAPLGNTGEKVTAATQSARAGRWAARAINWQISPFAAHRNCGRVSTHSGGLTAVVKSKTGARFAGLQTCSSPALCPVCSHKAGIKNAADIANLLEGVRRAGHTAAMVTLTMQHNAGHKLADMQAARTAGIRAANVGAAAKRHRTRYGITGTVRVNEETHGANGWHGHVHAIVIAEGKGQQAEENLRAYGDWLFERWQEGIGQTGFRAIKDSGGYDIQVGHAAALAGLADYLTKTGQIAAEDVAGLLAGADFRMALEAAGGAGKQGKGKGRTPFQILLGAAASAKDKALWIEYARAIHGTRRISYTTGLRELYALPAEELAAAAKKEAEEAAEDRVVLLLPSETWRAVRATAWELLDLLDRGGLTALTAHLDARGLAYRLPKAGEPVPDDDGGGDAPPA